ncbi:MAG: crotonase/enoyl-CoA hydratase family protein [Candidatus Rokubacteria bacterium]|nr:crotonase/enoyl-CoA hydratase family protein [Candidatus Rokubacteria bacterium]
MSATVRIDTDGPVRIITIDRPEVRNAVDEPTREALADAFRAFDEDERASVAILTGAHGVFCAGADLKAFAAGKKRRRTEDGDGPMGPTRMILGKPTIAAVEGYAVAGGLELALWCDMRVAAEDAVFGVYCRRWGVPLIDLGTVRLPRLIGQSHAMDLILTGRGVSGDEALRMGLANRLTPKGQALAGALELAKDLAALPQRCLRSDRLSALEQWSLGWREAMLNEFHRGMTVISSGESKEGATRFASGAGRHGARG